MAIRPTDIRRKEFRSGFRGYEANEVDDFLDEVADEFERAFSENQRLTEEVNSLRERLEQFEQLENSIREALVQAQQVAEDMRRSANKEAELIVREAKEQSHRILADSSARVERVQESYEVLRQTKQEFANDFRHLLKSYIAVMDNVDVASAREIEASLREHLDLEAVAVAREAAETRRTGRGRDERDEREGLENEHEEPGIGKPVAREEADETQIQDPSRQITTTVSPSGDRPVEAGPEPEAEEPEVDPSGVQSPTGPEAAPEETTAPSPGHTAAAEEVDREEPMPAGENRPADDFFAGREERTDESEERKIFRASRFLRRRG